MQFIKENSTVLVSYYIKI